MYFILPQLDHLVQLFWRFSFIATFWTWLVRGWQRAMGLCKRFGMLFVFLCRVCQFRLQVNFTIMNNFLIVYPLNCLTPSFLFGNSFSSLFLCSTASVVQCIVVGNHRSLHLFLIHLTLSK